MWNLVVFELSKIIYKIGFKETNGKPNIHSG